MRNPGVHRALVSGSRLAFAGAIAFFGVQHFLYGDFVTRLLPAWSEATPNAVAVPAVGVGLVLVGLAFTWGTTARVAAVVLGVLSAVSVLALHLPRAIPDVLWAGSWTTTGKVLVLFGGAFLVAQSHPPGPATPPWLARVTDALAPLARWLLGAFLILTGIQHFIWDEFVASLVPAWIPPGGYFWAYVTGVLLIAGGVALWWHRTTWLAAILSSLMIFLWFILLHIPRAIASPAGESNEWTSVFEALAVSAIALLIADRHASAEPRTTG